MLVSDIRNSVCVNCVSYVCSVASGRRTRVRDVLAHQAELTSEVRLREREHWGLRLALGTVFSASPRVDWNTQCK